MIRAFFKFSAPFGTILLSGLLLFLHSPFLFGYAKPVPINFRALHNPRRDMVLVAAAGPAMNIVLALIAAMMLYLVGYLPDTGDAAKSPSGVIPQEARDKAVCRLME
jgi:Zn-dependent protease